MLQNRLLGGQAGPRIFVAFGCGDFCLPRCDCREAAVFPQRKHLHHQFFGRERWRCPAPEFLWGRDVSDRVLLANWSLIMVFVLCLVCSMMFSIVSPVREGWISWFPLHTVSCLDLPQPRCNLRGAKLYPYGRKHLCRGVVGKAKGRCRAGELLWSCWGRLRMSVVIAAPYIRFWGLERNFCGVSEICVFEMFGVFAIQSRWPRHSWYSCIWCACWFSATK